VIRFSTYADEEAILYYETGGGQAQPANRLFNYSPKGTLHELELPRLRPATRYRYQIAVKTPLGDQRISPVIEFTTAPEVGANTPFTFAYASDSRKGQGGGERNIWGTNAYIMKRIGALAAQENVAFMQFTGDMINGYLTSPLETRLEYANWKRAVEPYWQSFPWFTGMGNHEVITRSFNYGGEYGTSVDRFPFDTESGEAVFRSEFTNPTNGPDSEDGAVYDPNPKAIDFPSYKESVYYYLYGNTAMVVLNSDYLYAPSLDKYTRTSGGLHGYLLDQQLAWLATVLDTLEKDSRIRHVFVTQHTPAFPNGGHRYDTMWYDGDNEKRPYIAGKPVPKGIIERRDQYLDLLINKSSKVRAILTGDEHNYCRLPIFDGLPRYPEGYPVEKKQPLKRKIWQINNGAAGAPYYAMEELPWSNYLPIFSTQNALVFITVDGEKLSMVVRNPDTLEVIETIDNLLEVPTPSR
jgi:hypothetical protein